MLRQKRKREYPRVETRRHPKNALAVTLVGQVLATSPEGVAKAKKAFAKALELDAACTRAALQLVEVHIKQQDYAPCIKLLQNSLHARSRDVLHTKLADVYSLNDQHSDALAYFLIDTRLDASPFLYTWKKSLFEKKQESSLPRRFQSGRTLSRSLSF